MYLSTTKKQEIFKEYGKGPEDTGSSEGQIALFSHRIKHLTAHLKNNKKDFASTLAIQKLVSKRRRLIKYLKNKDIERYRSILKRLALKEVKPEARAGK